MGSAGSAGAGGNAQAGTDGYVQLVAEGIIPGSGTITGYSTPAGRVYEVPGYPDAADWSYDPTGSAGGSGAVWHSASDDVQVGAPTTGAFAAYSTQSTNFIQFTGDGNRHLNVGPLNLSAVEKMVFTVIKGNGSNGGDSPEEPMYLYYKTSPEQAAPTFLQEIVSSAVGASGYAQYEIDLDENHAARVGGIYLYLQQVRPSGGDNTEENDNYGLAQIGLKYGPVTTQVFTPASNATLPGNEGICGPDGGLNVIRKTCTATESNIRFSDGTFSLSTSTPISVNATATPTTPIPLVTRYHRAKYLIKAF